MTALAPGATTRPEPARGTAAIAAALAAHRAGQFAEAERSYRAILAQNPHHFDALHLLGALRAQQRDFAESAKLIERALALRPGVALAHHNLGHALTRLGRAAAAVEEYRKAVAIDAHATDSWVALARLLVDLARPFEAREAAQRAAAQRPESALVQQTLGMALAISGDPAAARRALECAAVELDDLHTRNFLGIVGFLQGRYADAAAHFAAALELDPDDVSALTNHAHALSDVPGANASDGLAAYRDFLARHPGNFAALGGLVHAAQLCGAWDDLLRHAPAVIDAIRQGHDALQPIAASSLVDEPDVLQRVSRHYVRRRAVAVPQREPLPEPRPRARLRVAYVSSNFSSHPVGHSIGDLFRLHDRAVVQVIGISTGANDASDVRQSLIAACDEFYDVATLSSEAAAGVLRALDLNVAVDLAGHTGESRPELLATRIAPVQANYFGFPGTWGHRCMDYLIADGTVVPPGAERWYDEAIVRLPDSYFVTDTTVRPADFGPRASAGLPEDAFVFACFNTAHKVLPGVFDAWLRILAAVPGSVLWLTPGSKARAENFRAVAARSGLDPTRLVFAERVPGRAEYLGRLRLADLFLDTVPFNAHSTARDALWAGLPVLTCSGRSFAARVGASLVRAAGLPELATESLEEYEALAIQLARSPGTLAELRARLQDPLRTAPLFDMHRRCRHLEWAYRAMHQRAVDGAPAQALEVPPSGSAAVHDG